MVIGAGLTGLSAALYLSRAGYGVTVLESSTTVGGRMNSRVLDGYVIDAGFQISLSSYPLLREICSPWDEFERSVSPRSFLSGAKIFTEGDRSHIEIYNPVRHPLRFITQSYSSQGIPNLISVRNMRAAVQLLPWMLGAVKPSGCSTREVLEKVNFSPELEEQFLLPFLKGVLLDPELLVDGALTGLLLRYFAMGNAILFKDGAGSLPRYLHSLLPPNTVQFSTRCTGFTRIDRGFSISAERNGKPEAILADGVIATLPLYMNDFMEHSPIPTLQELLRDSFPKLRDFWKDCRSLTSRTLLYSATMPPYSEPLLTLNGSGHGEINHLSVLTNVQPSYAPQGSHLIAVCTKSGSTASDTALGGELATWFPNGRTSEWRCIDDSTVSYALPAPALLGDGYLSSDGLVLAGDGLSYGSQNGALLAGKRAAQHMLSILA